MVDQTPFEAFKRLNVIKTVNIINTFQHKFIKIK